MAICIARRDGPRPLRRGWCDPPFPRLVPLGGHRHGGVQTREVLSSALGADDLAAAAARYFSANPKSSAGNGSLMRTAPVALACLGGDDALVGRAMAISALTHADPLAGEACAIWCVAIDRAVRLGTSALEAVREGVGLLAPARAPLLGEKG
ncbi:MAG: ADP-ribosylglycohydrolase family protein [Actinomycetota bacterium]|nr:ADP-ribosylglycohydrolase family protein [Actinomycetota bacterium]